MSFGLSLHSSLKEAFFKFNSVTNVANNCVYVKQGDVEAHQEKNSLPGSALFALIVSFFCLFLGNRLL